MEKELIERKLREEMLEYGKKLLESGLVQGTWGNISARLDQNYMLVTPSGTDYNRLTADDMVKVKIDSLEHQGNIKPTSEKELHAEIYKARQDVGAIIHTHSKYCSVFAAARKDMPILGEYKEVFAEVVKTAKYALPGTKKLAQNTAAALGQNLGVIMANHGMAACGTDMQGAFENCVKLEENAQKYLLTI